MDLITTELEVNALHVVAILIVVSLVAITVNYWSNAIGTSHRPDLYNLESTVPLLGNLFWAITTGPRQLETFWMLRKAKALRNETRTTSITIPGLRMVDASNPADIEHIQKTNSNNYIKGPLFEKNMSDILGAGIFVVDHDQWRVARKATAKIFTGALFRTVISSSIDTDLAKMQQIMRHHAKTGESLDLVSLFFAFTLSTFSRMAFSVDLLNLGEKDTTEVPFARAFDFAQLQMAARFNNPFWPLTERFTANGRRMKESIKILDDFAYRIIDEREREGLGALEKATAARTDLLSLYMALRDENGEPLSRQALRDAVLNLIIAGRDTTAQSLSWLFFHLISNPEHVVALREEADKTPLVDYDSYKLMNQSLAAFHEGLRLHPSVPKNAHQAVADDVLPSGTKIKKGDVCRWSDWEMGRMESIWGPRAGTFDPKRWIDANGEVIRESQYKFHAFNGGARLCLGQNLATFESVAALSAIVREFDLTFAPEFSPEMIDVGDAIKTPRYEDSLTLPMRAPLLVKVALRSK